MHLKAWMALSITMMLLQTSGALSQPQKINRIGINPNGSAGIDYNVEKPWADAMRSHRNCSKIADWNSGITNVKLMRPVVAGSSQSFPWCV